MTEKEKFCQFAPKEHDVNFPYNSGKKSENLHRRFLRGGKYGSRKAGRKLTSGGAGIKLGTTPEKRFPFLAVQREEKGGGQGSFAVRRGEGGHCKKKGGRGKKNYGGRGREARVHSTDTKEKKLLVFTAQFLTLELGCKVFSSPNGIIC